MSFLNIYIFKTLLFSKARLGKGRLELHIPSFRQSLKLNHNKHNTR